jgi:hypothetical protein
MHHRAAMKVLTPLFVAALAAAGPGVSGCSSASTSDPVEQLGSEATSSSDWVTGCPLRMRLFGGGAPPPGFVLEAIPNADHRAIYLEGENGVGALPTRRKENAEVKAGMKRSQDKLSERLGKTAPIQVFPDDADGLPHISGVVIHTTNGPTARSAYETWASSGTSAHYIVDLNGDVSMAVPECHIAFHAPDELSNDARFRNQYTIGIEHVGVPFNATVGRADRASVPGFSDGDIFTSTPKQLAASKVLIRDICKRYGLKCKGSSTDEAPDMSTQPDLFRHHDLVATQCPGQWPLKDYLIKP